MICSYLKIIFSLFLHEKYDSLAWLMGAGPAHTRPPGLRWSPTLGCCPASAEHSADAQGAPCAFCSPSPLPCGLQPLWSPRCSSSSSAQGLLRSPWNAVPVAPWELYSGHGLGQLSQAHSTHSHSQRLPPFVSWCLVFGKHLLHIFCQLCVFCQQHIGSGGGGKYGVCYFILVRTLNHLNTLESLDKIISWEYIIYLSRLKKYKETDDFPTGNIKSCQLNLQKSLGSIVFTRHPTKPL